MPSSLGIIEQSSQIEAIFRRRRSNLKAGSTSIIFHCLYLATLFTATVIYQFIWRENNDCFYYQVDLPNFWSI